MGTTSEKLTYLNTTKGKIKDSINLTGANITNEPFRQYSTKLQDAYVDIINNGTDTLYNNFPKVSGEGTSLTLNNTYQAPMRNNLKGNTSQTGTPTPTSPIPVNVVSGDNEIIVCGKNLFDKSNANTLNCLLNGTNGSIANYNRAKSLYIPIQSSKTYTISKVLSARFVVGTCVSTPANGVTCNVYRANNTGTSITITSGASDKFLCVFYYLSGTDTLTEQQILDSIQIEKGSSATTYEPYQGNTYNIDLPVENLFELPATQTINGITFTNNGNGTFNLSGTASAIADFKISKELNTITNGSYTISCKSAGYSLQLVFYNGNTWLSTPINKLLPELLKTGNITIPSNATKYSLIIRVTSGSTINLINETVQLEKGSKANAYTPFGTTPIELCKIGTYQDYFYKDSDKWYLHKEIGKVVLNGSENISIYNQNTNRTNFQVDILTGIENYSGGNNVPNLLSNMFNVASQSATWTVGNISRRREAQTTLYLTYNPNTTVEAFKTWLASNNVSCYYIYATPTNTEITDTTLINQLEELYIAKSKENQTNISQINNDLGFIISASALKKG